MVVKVIGSALLVVGAVCCYLAKWLYRFIKKQEPNEAAVLKLKLSGLLAVIAGALVLFLV